jgi:hypothetical protein
LLLPENVGHHALHGAMCLADKKTLVAFALVSSLSLSHVLGPQSPRAC